MMLPSGTVVHTPNQTAGRGQRGNSWESEPGKNASFSMLLKGLSLPVSRQFCISEAVALAVCDVLSGYADGFSVKWPNDIYHGDRKVGGILIEHSVMGTGLKHSVLGVGININQTEFLSDAPNPVSLAMILGREVPVEEVLHAVCEEIERRCAFNSYSDADFDALHSSYLAALYRKDGALHGFALPEGERFEARIADVEPAGMLVLEKENGELSRYAFKEVQFVI